MLVGMAQSWVKLADQAATISSPAERAGGQGSRGCRLGNRYPEDQTDSGSEPGAVTINRRDRRVRAVRGPPGP